MVHHFSWFGTSNLIEQELHGIEGGVATITFTVEQGEFKSKSSMSWTAASHSDTDPDGAAGLGGSTNHG